MGALVGPSVGALVGPSVGAFVGALVGDLVGASVGALVGASVGTAHPLSASISTYSHMISVTSLLSVFLLLNPPIISVCSPAERVVESSSIVSRPPFPFTSPVIFITLSSPSFPMKSPSTDTRISEYS